MDSHLKRTLAAAAVAAATLSGMQPAVADSSKAPAIAEAHADPSNTVLQVNGANLAGATPKLTLGTIATPLTVTLATATRIEALLPVGIAPGSYLLSLTMGKGKGNEREDANGDVFWVTLGAAGPQGPAGPQGAAGAQGPVGPAGVQGPAGATGPAGPAGKDGATGPAGPAGKDGATGPAGPAGKDGATGPAGPQGTPGVAGPAGPAGSAGAPGLQGPRGIAGNSIALVGPAPKATCENGGSVFEIVGEKGPIPGTQTVVCNGMNGLNGAAGPAGPQGATGPQGPAGPAGSTLTPSTFMMHVAGATTFTFLAGIYEVVANCPAGSVVTGGGFSQFQAIVVEQFKSGNGWVVRARADGLATASLDAYAICLQFL